MTISELEAVIEAILFASGDIVNIKSIAFATGEKEKTIKSVIENMADRLDERKSGVQIIQFEDGYQMCSRSDYFEFFKKIFKAPKRKVLSSTLLETLAIIAYKQPITRSQIEEIRGVSAEHSLNKLLEYNLIKEAGRLEGLGKPILFETTTEFLRYFGFSSIDALPENVADIESIKKEAEMEVESLRSV